MNSTPRAAKPPPKSAALFLFITIFLGTTFAWSSYLRFRPPDPKDFTTVRATLVSWKESTSGSKIPNYLLDITVQENDVRYRIPLGVYKLADRDSFRARAQYGSPLELKVRAGDLPFKPLLDDQSTIFAFGLRLAGDDILTLEDYIASRTQGNGSALLMACFGTLMLAGLLILWLFPSLRSRQRGPPHAPA